MTDLQFISKNWPRKKKETDDSKSKEPMSPESVVSKGKPKNQREQRWHIEAQEERFQKIGRTQTFQLSWIKVQKKSVVSGGLEFVLAV